MDKSLLIQRQLNEASGKDQAPRIEALLSLDPKPDPNWGDPEDYGHTALHLACASESLNSVDALLKLPHLDPNRGNKHGWTPFLLCCVKGKILPVKHLLNDVRVNINQPDSSGATPLWWACARGSVLIVKWMIASGRWFDLDRRGKSVEERDRISPIDVARKSQRPDLASLLERYRANQAAARREIKAELGIRGLRHPPPAFYGTMLGMTSLGFFLRLYLFLG